MFKEERTENSNLKISFRKLRGRIIFVSGFKEDEVREVFKNGGQKGYLG